MLESALEQDSRRQKEPVETVSRRKHEKYQAVLMIGRSLFEPNADRLVADLSEWWGYRVQ